MSLFTLMCGCIVFTLHTCSSSDSSYNSDTNSGYTSSSGTNGASTNAIYYSKCDPVIVAKIYQVWQTLYGGWPTNLIETATRNYAEVVTHTTWNYYSKDVKCVKSYFNNTSVTINSVYRNGTCVSRNITVSECEGKTVSTSKADSPFSTNNTLYRYHVIGRKGVTCVYTCMECGVSLHADKKPDGFMKFAESGFSPAVAQQCLDTMNHLGIPLEERLPQHCDDSCC